MSFMRNMFGPPDVKLLKAKRDIDGLIKALSYDKDEGIRREAAKALSQMGKPVVGPVGAALHEETDIQARKSMIIILSRVGGTEAVAPLMAVMGDKNEDLAKMGIIALVKMGPGVAKPLLNALAGENEQVRTGAAMALKQLNDKRLVKPLMALAHQQPEHDAIPQIADILGAMGEKSIEPLAAYIQQHPIPLPRWPVQALGRTGSVNAVQPLIEVLLNEEQNHEVRYDAAQALGEIKDRSAVEPLITVLNDRSLDWYVRGAAAQALGEIGDRRAIAPLNSAMDDRFTTGRKMAAEALKKIEEAPLPEHFSAEDIYKAGSWWGSPPEPFEVVEYLTLIGSRAGEKVDSVDINEAVKEGIIHPDAHIFLCDTLPAQFEESDMEETMVEVLGMVAGKNGMDWENIDWGAALIDTRVRGRKALVISNGVNTAD